MPRGSRASLLFALAMAVPLAAGPGPQQAPDGAGSPSSGSDAASVRIDAVVTDRHGRPILDLRPGDFELLENGAPRPIGAVELRTIARPAPADASPIETEADEERAAGAPGTRVFAFFLDEFHVSPGASSERVRAALAHFIDEQLAPGDLALVMKPLDAVTAIRFTRDRAALHRAVASFDGRRGDYSPRTRFEEEYIGHAVTAVTAARAQIVTAGLRELAMRLGDLHADRGVVVLVSEGFARDAAVPPPRQSRVPDLQGIVRAASRFHLAMYTFNPDDRESDADGVAERERGAATLQWLAAQTGGQSVIDGDQLEAGLRRMSADLAAYYALTYQPAQADGRFHAVEVRARRRDAQVRARPGYWAPLGGEWRRASAPLAIDLSRRALHRTTAINPWVGIQRDADGRARMIVTWEPERTPAGRLARLVTVKARTAAGGALFDGELAPLGGAVGAVKDSVRFDVPPGRVELDMSIAGVDGKVIDTDARDFEVPTLVGRKSGPVILSPELVRARTMRDFEAATADPDAAPSGVRVFGRGERLIIRVPAFDSSGLDVRVTAAVLNGRGQPMRQIDPAPPTATPWVTQFAFPLSWLAPGEYAIELTGTNANGAVTERLAFRVVG